MVKKLRIRFTLTASLILLLVFIIIGVVINSMNYYNFYASTDKIMKIIAANNGEFPDYEDYLKMVEEERLRQEDEKKRDPLGKENDSVTAETAYETRYFCVRFSPDGKMISSDLTHIAEMTKEDAERLGGEVIKKNFSSGTLKNYRYYMHEISSRSDGETTEIIFLNCAGQLGLIKYVRTVSILTLAGVLAAVSAAIWLMSKRIVKPFVDNLDKQKKFITDAGHEIKTPLAIIDANAEVLKLTEGENEWIDSIQNQTARLTTLVKKLVALAKSEESSDASFEKFNISEAAEETVSPFTVLAEKNDIRLETDIENGIVYDGNEASIRQLFSILLDNAIKYTPAGGNVRVSLRERSKITFEVYNDCDALDPEKIPKYFDRFYRADVSRSRETGGYGIGLSIAKTIADKHKGKITAESDDGRSITFSVIL